MKCFLNVVTWRHGANATGRKKIEAECGKYKESVRNRVTVGTHRGQPQMELLCGIELHEYFNMFVGTTGASLMCKAKPKYVGTV